MSLTSLKHVTSKYFSRHCWKVHSWYFSGFSTQPLICGLKHFVSLLLFSGDLHPNLKPVEHLFEPFNLNFLLSHQSFDLSFALNCLIYVYATPFQVSYDCLFLCSLDSHLILFKLDCEQKLEQFHYNTTNFYEELSKIAWPPDGSWSFFSLSPPHI